MSTTFRRTLRLNSPLHRGADVLAMQMRLGVSAAQCDGIFGPATQQAVMAFQKQNRLPADGVVGPETWSLLFGENPEPDTDIVRPSIRHAADQLGSYHGYYPDSVKWRLTPDGIEIEGSGIETSAGSPETVRRVCLDYQEPLERASRLTGVPVELLVATLCTAAYDNAARAINPRAENREPGYISDAATPHRAAYGLMLTSIASARHALSQLTMEPAIGEDAIDRNWLFVPANAILAGAAQIAAQSRRTRLDPPLVACAYCAGDVLHDPSSRNRWKMRQYPLGGDAYANRFVQWFNDCFRLFKAESCPFDPAVSFWRQLNSESPGAGSMEYVFVSFKEDRTVLVDGVPLGPTGQTLMVVRGHHRITLDGEQNYRPEVVDAVIQNSTTINPYKISFD